MTDDLHTLKKGYRAIEAPGHLAAKIRAEVANDRSQAQHWIPATVSVLTVAGILGILPLVLQQQVVVSEKPVKPSLSALTSLLPEKPARSTASLSQLRSVRVPKMPPKPKPAKPQANFQIEDDLLKENDHALI